MYALAALVLSAMKVMYVRFISTTTIAIGVPNNTSAILSTTTATSTNLIFPDFSSTVSNLTALSAPITSTTSKNFV